MQGDFLQKNILMKDLFDEDFFKEEIRADYVVTEKMKKVWAIELDLLAQFDHMCKEHGLKYYAAYGTLLGAVRHHGFIPWDDDLDVFMMREDYAVFEKIAKDYFQYPYEFQGIDNGFVLSAHTKIRNANTTALEYETAPASYNQGIFIDVFPLDDGLNDGVTNPMIFDIQKLLWQIATHPQEMARLVQLGQKFILDGDLIMELCQAGPFETLNQLEILCLEHNGKSDRVNFLTDEIMGLHKSFRKECFKKTIEMPFENITIPVPSEYDEILQEWYGDYMTPKQVGGGHTLLVLDPDKPYTEYLKNSK